jgi:3-carboxy-cis,cis-muconate cycloisomerase
MSDALFTSMVGAAEVEAHLSDRAFVAAMLEVEAVLADESARVGLIPPEAAEAIAVRCEVEGFDIASIGRRGAAHASVVVPLVADLRAAVPEPFRQYVHAGTTSQDILDTALCLVAKRALAPILADLEATGEALAALAQRHIGTAQIGRTLLQQAEPTTFGLVCAGWLVELDDALAGLRRVRDERLAVQLGGPVGTQTQLHGQPVMANLARRLDLAEPELPWHTGRQRIGELAASIGLAAGALGTIARDVTLLAQTELAEVTEGEPGGSSSMPHKRNPARSVLVLACCQQVPGLVAGVLAGMTQELQRAAGAWQAEAPAIVRLLRLLGAAATQTRTLVGGLRVDVSRMAGNLDAYGWVPDDELFSSAEALVGRVLRRRAAAR